MRGADGRLADDQAPAATRSRSRNGSAADADARLPDGQGAGQGIACDPTGCVGRLADGRLVALSLDPSAFAEDCRRAFAAGHVPRCAAGLRRDRDRPQACAAARRRFIIATGNWEIGTAARPVGPRPAVGAGARGRTKRRRQRGSASARPGRRSATPRRSKMKGDDLWLQDKAALQPRKDCAFRSATGRALPFRLRIKRPSRISRRGPQARLIRAIGHASSLNTVGTVPPSCPGCARGWAAESVPRRRYWPARARSKRRGGGSA